MNKVLRFALVLVVITIAIYLMLTLLTVFLILAGIGVVYLLFIRIFKKPRVAKESAQGVTIELEAVVQDDDVEQPKRKL